MMLIRARLRRDTSVASLAPLLLPDELGARAGAAHRLVWTLFGDNPDRKRDFLWREDKPGQFLILAKREPRNEHGLFDIECKDFAPVLAPGDRLGFLLRANPTIQPAASQGEKRPPRSDVVMHALYGMPKGEQRATARPEQVEQAGTAWLQRQAAQKGFAVDAGKVRVDGYETWRIPRGRIGRGKPVFISYSTLDLSGVLQVTEPAQFLSAMEQGFGRAKTFGCGLMLIRRAAT